MTPTQPTASTARPLLAAAHAAIERRELQRADALFLEHLANARNDVVALRDYGRFCLQAGRAANACYLLHKANALQPGDSEQSNLLGYAHVALREFDAARPHFEAVLNRSPADRQAQYGLGLCLQHAGEWIAAAGAFAASLQGQAATDALPILLHLADACGRAGDDAQARMHYAHLERIAPDHPAMLLAYGRFLRERGDAAQAMQRIDRGGKQHPDEPQFLIEKARCLRALGDAAHAQRWLDRLGTIAPEMPELASERGDCLADAGDIGNAMPHWLRAIDLWNANAAWVESDALVARMLAFDPTNAAAWNARGGIEKGKHAFAAAESGWRKALELQPGRIDASASLALLLESTNRVAEAKTVAEQAAAAIGTSRDQHGASELLLVLAKTLRRTHDRTGALHALDRIEALDPDNAQRMNAQFERGKLLDLMDDASAAIAAFTAGNEIAQANWLRANPGRNRFLAGIDFMLDAMRDPAMRDWKPIDDLPEARDVAFLVGFPRSGTTLLNQVLDGHPAIQAIEEKPLASRITAGLRAMPRGYPFALADLDAVDVAWLRDGYFRSAAEHGAADPSRLLLDKFPANTVLAGMLQRVFPSARFVLALRHPCDVVLSCFMQHFELNNTMANFCTLADTVALYTRVMDLWQAWRDALPLHVHTVRYEDVVDDFDGQVGALCDFLGVPWRDDLRDFSAKALERGRINTPSYEQVSRPIYREARYRWERYRAFLEPHLPALQPYIERFGYARAS